MLSATATGEAKVPVTTTLEAEISSVPTGSPNLAITTQNSREVATSVSNLDTHFSSPVRGYPRAGAVPSLLLENACRGSTMQSPGGQEQWAAGVFIHWERFAESRATPGPGSACQS